MFDCLKIGLGYMFYPYRLGKMQPNSKKGNGSVLYFMYMYMNVTTN